MRRTRKANRKTRKVTRRMKGGNYLNSLKNAAQKAKNAITRKNTVAPRPNTPYREGSVAYNSAKRVYEQNKGKVEELVKRLDEAVVKAWEPILEKYGIESKKNSNNLVKLIKEKMKMNDFKDVMQGKVTIEKEGIKEAQEAIENYLKISAKVKKSMLQKVVGKFASQSKAARDVMDLLGIANESIDSLFNHIDNDTLTVAKAFILSTLIKKHEGLLKKAESGNLPQSGGKEEFGAIVILTALLPIAIGFAAQSFGASVIIYLILAFIIIKSTMD